ncbi:MAG: DUF2284 domain-containing protein [Lachnospiraceae bacterium]
MLEQILEVMQDAGVYQSGTTHPKKVTFLQEVRDICADNTCRKYGTSWACPPAVGTVEECRTRCLSYDTMIVFTGKYDLEDSFDYEGMIQGIQDFKKLALKVDALVSPFLEDYLVLSNESCELCSDCTYPDAPCRFPDQMQHSLEGYGIMVGELAKMTGVNYNNGPNSVTYFGALLFSDKLQPAN